MHIKLHNFVISGENSYFPGKKYLAQMLKVTDNLQQALYAFKTMICALQIIQDVFLLRSFLTAIQVTLVK